MWMPVETSDNEPAHQVDAAYSRWRVSSEATIAVISGRHIQSCTRSARIPEVIRTPYCKE